MKLQQGDIITLSDGDNYLVVSVADVSGETYFFIISDTPEENERYCKLTEQNGTYTVNFIEDQQEIYRIVPYLYRAVEQDIKELKEENTKKTPSSGALKWDEEII